MAFSTVVMSLVEPRRRSPFLPLPVLTQGCPGKLCIAKADLVGGGLVAGGGRVDLGGPVDIGEWLSDEQRCCDEADKTDGWHEEAAFARGEPQQQISDHGSNDLKADRVLGTADELAQLQMLLDPAEHQLDLPAGFVKCGELDGWAFQI